MNLSQEQMDAIDAIVNGTGDLAITAPAGSGKTDVAVRGIIQAVLSHKVKADELLFISFSRAAMQSIQHRMMSSNIPQQAETLAKNVCTFASHGLKMAELNTFDMKRCVDAKHKAMKHALLERSVAGLDSRPFPMDAAGNFLPVRYNPLSKAAQELLRVSSMALAEGVDLAAPTATAWCSRNGLSPNYQNMWRVYNNQLDKHGLWSFDQLARNHHANATAKYKWIVIDEAQDTTPFQLDTAYRYLKPGGRLILIGDVRQSVHGWRGVKVELFRDFVATAHHQPLTLNFRSPPEIVNVANALLKDQEWSPTITTSARPSQPNAAKRASRLDAHAALMQTAKALQSGATIPFSIAVLARTHKDLDWVEQLFENMGLTEAHYFRKAPPSGSDEEESEMRGYRPGVHTFLLSTIHGVKGLGFDTVFVLQTPEFSYDDMIEWIQKKRNLEKYAEEFRLMYTALTRAQETLVLVENRNLPAKPWPV